MKSLEVKDLADDAKKIQDLAKLCVANDQIDPELYNKYDVRRGLRYPDGRGVMTGLTEIAEVKAYTIVDSETVPVPGQLFYRGYDIKDLVGGFSSERRLGFEETTYLLMFGKLPTSEELNNFKDLLSEHRKLPTNFVRDVIMKAPSMDMMNSLMKSVLTLYAYDPKPDNTSVENVLRQCLSLIAVTPLLVGYGYQAYKHYKEGGSLVIHQPKFGNSTAETLFHMLRDDGKYSKLEARVLDLCLCIHADHGGGNNSAFTTRVVTSTMTDTYSSMAAALASLKGPRHGGANLKVNSMMTYLEGKVKDWKDDDEISYQLTRILEKKCFDRAGLIYGIGHAVYSISDPRAEILKGFAEKLAKDKGKMEEFEFFNRVESLAPDLISSKRVRNREFLCANVDFYSGFVYRLLGIPTELFTPIFAVARMSGWSAHRLEEIVSGSRIIRPGYKNIAKHTEYVPIKQR